MRVCMVWGMLTCPPARPIHIPFYRKPRTLISQAFFHTPLLRPDGVTGTFAARFTSLPPGTRRREYRTAHDTDEMAQRRPPKLVSKGNMVVSCLYHSDQHTRPAPLPLLLSSAKTPPPPPPRLPLQPHPSPPSPSNSPSPSPPPHPPPLSLSLLRPRARAPSRTRDSPSLPP